MKGSCPLETNLSYLSFVNIVWDHMNVRSFVTLTGS